ncbi:MAG TPA: tRNA (adenosine(37)-N6)-threonylcarbamoyltransferase complex ATPase subunit type 1 TsaE [Gemmatimonadales bacterium]|nr:tRNA (adenosine(37)-N6)-threonylcarbamoyltransferase complex ATPase subunit type 1 TsaE [Gemmatimonadales bacterium]HKE92379.1 tRNA (adenosine(37)-N6)-threonylcarbamoyltransferase complex ATPase subunit type 1 TsaE [Gemmatimonadales bacterium]
MRLREDELNRFGEDLGAVLRPPVIIGISGELGTGKTTLVQAICRGIGAEVPATSPTYALVHRYESSRGPVYHVDCYRIKSSKEARDLGLDDILLSKAILLVEWPENAGHMMPPLDRYFHLRHDSDGVYRVLEER